MFALRELYSQYGYSHFKMSKFEEYDFYAQCRNFLHSDSIITFTGAGGRLMALRPDVTLSIIKNVKGDPPDPVKACYNEYVYRSADSASEPTEILQAGLECIGDIDLYQSAEVLLLAVKSLALIGERYVLDLSHMGFLAALMEEAGISLGARGALLSNIGAKNAHGIREICAGAGVSDEFAERIAEAATMYGTPTDMLPRLRALSTSDAAQEALDELEALCRLLSVAGDGEHIRLDLSIVHDMDYYNGVIMSGFIEGIPRAVLSGGRYDRLLSRMGKRGGAMGFAVSLDLLDRFADAPRGCDADILLLYDESCDPAALMRAVRMFCDSGKSVRAEKRMPEGFRYRQLLRMKDRGIEILENMD